jgi:hypothetical protein
VLWAFLFALREEAVEQLGWDSFPLILFDDPQATFDAEHRHRWAQYVAQLQSGRSRVQLILATFDETFLGLVKMDGITGRRALIAPASLELGHVAIFEGNALDRKWDSARKVNTAESAREYLMAVRIHLEGMLKLMLRGEDPGVPMFTLNDCRVRIKLLQESGIPPWNNPAFKTLLAALDKGRPEIQYLEASHHTTGFGFGMGEATNVEKHWRKNLCADLERGFRVTRDYRLLHGGSKVLHAPTPTVTLPDGYQVKVRAIPLKILGQAAALSNGRVADGLVSVDEFLPENHSMVVLGHHWAYRLVASTLEPVARPGDILLVREHGEPSPRSLVVAISGERVLARRFELSDDFSDIAVLTAQSINPRMIAPPLVAQKSTLTLYKVVGVVFDEFSRVAEQAGAEICDCGGEAALSHLTSGSLGLVEVVGDSAEPLALDGQYLIVRPKVASAEELRKLEGKPIIAIDSEDNRYFKRLRSTIRDMVVLESLASGGDFPPIVLSALGSEGRCLESVWPVVGVLFERSN